MLLTLFTKLFVRYWVQMEDITIQRFKKSGYTEQIFKQ